MAPRIVCAVTVYSPGLVGTPRTGIKEVDPSNTSTIVPDPSNTGLLPSVSEDTECASFDRIKVRAPSPPLTDTNDIVSEDSISSSSGSVKVFRGSQPSGISAMSTETVAAPATKIVGTSKRVVLDSCQEDTTPATVNRYNKGLLVDASAVS